MDPHSQGGASVLVPGIDAPSSVACVRSLGRRGIGTIVASESRTTPAAASRYCDEFVAVPDPREDLADYGAALRSNAERADVNTVVPVREEDAYALSRARDDFASTVATPWPEFETLRRVQDRVELFGAAEAAGVATPETAPVDEWDDWDRETIVKPRYTLPAPEYLGEAAADAEIGSTVYRRPGEPLDPGDCRARYGHVPLVQEYVPTPREYGFFALYDEGEAVATFQHVQRRGWTYAGGPSAYRESIDIDDLDAAGRALLDELDWHGLAMVEFLRDPDTGEFELMEVNPRFWSSLPFTVRAGADLPYYYWQLAIGDPPAEPPAYEVGTAAHLLRGEASYLHSVVAEDYPLVERPSLGTALRDVAASFVAHPRFDYAVADDPLPFLRDGWNVVRDALNGGSTEARADPDAESATDEAAREPDGTQPPSSAARSD